MPTVHGVELRVKRHVLRPPVIQHWRNNHFDIGTFRSAPSLYSSGFYSVQSAVTVYATDPSLVYAGSWTTAATSTAASTLTYQYTKTQGASVSLTFQGTAVNWFTRESAKTGTAKVSIDGASVETPDLSAGMNATQIPKLVEVFSSGTLSAGTHSITVSLNGPGSFGAIYMENFYFVYTPSENAVITPVNPTAAVTATNPVTATNAITTTLSATTLLPNSSSTNSSLPNSNLPNSNTTLLSAETATVTSGVTATTTATYGNDTSSSANSPNGSSKHSAIIGGITAGAIVAFCLLASLIIYLVRRRRREQEKADNAVRVADPFTAQGDYQLSDRPSPDVSFSSKERLLEEEAHANDTAMLEESWNKMMSNTSNTPGPSLAVPSSTRAVTPSPSNLSANEWELGGPPPAYF